MFWRLSAFYLFYFAAVGVYVIFFPKALQMVGYSTLQIGILLSASPLMRFFAPFLFLRHLKLDDRTFLGALTLMSLAVVLFYPALPYFWALLTVNLLFGAAMSVTLPFIPSKEKDFNLLAHWPLWTAFLLMQVSFGGLALAQQFFLGISYGLGGFAGAIVAGRIYGDNLFLIESFIALAGFFILFFENNKMFSVK